MTSCPYLFDFMSEFICIGPISIIIIIKGIFKTLTLRNSKKWCKQHLNVADGSSCSQCIITAKNSIVEVMFLKLCVPSC